MINLSVLLIIDTQLSWKNQKKDKAKGATNQQAPVLEKEIKDCEKKKNDLTNRRVTRGGRGEGLPCPFLKIGKKCPNFWEKYPDCDQLCVGAFLSRFVHDCLSKCPNF